MNEDFIWPSNYDRSQCEELERVCNELEEVQDKLKTANKFISNMVNAAMQGGANKQMRDGIDEGLK